MEGSLQGYPIDSDDGKYLSGLSTILVATIQEMKDRISQIEYIFCSQLFPNFQSRSKILQKRFAEAMKSAEDGWRKKESGLLLQIEELKLERNQALEEIRNLVASLEKAKLANDESRKAAEDDWQRKESFLLHQIEELRLENKKVLEEKQSLLTSMENEKAAENDWGRKESFLLHQMEEIQLENKKALEEIQSLVASLKHEKAKSMSNKQLLDACDKEKKLLLAKLESLEKKDIANLQDQLKQKTDELAEGKRLQRKLLQQIEMKDSEVIIERKKRKDVVDSFKRVKSQYNFLLNKFDPNKEGSRMEEENNLSSRQQDLRTSHGLKSEDPEASGFVCKMKEPKNETGLEDKPEYVEGPQLMQYSTSPSNRKSPTSSSSRPQKCPSVKSESLKGIKRPASHWRETRSPASHWREIRSRQEPGGADPHDDFLDTPLENIKGNLNNVRKEIPKLALPSPKDMDFGSSDDETQDLCQEPASQKLCQEPAPQKLLQELCQEPAPQKLFQEPTPQKQRISIIKPDDKGYKYVEPVRKKADRENLKGYECKQCKKFYDAVLPDGGNNNNTNHRCEHHDGVSRHRYRYLPPSTPEGFWNIGFESEM